MNIYDYMDQYGIYSFDEKPFNEVDSAIFAFLSYADFDKVVEHKKIALKDAGRIFMGLHSKSEKNILAVREANKILKYMKDAKRYRDCLLYNYVYEGTKDLQFSALMIDYTKNMTYVSYEGTDQLISGWKENLLLSYSYPTLSHKKAIAYLNKHCTFGLKKYIVGGHSKGGNLALVAAMECNRFVKNKIVSVHNFDGPGLLDKEFRSKQFKNLLPKYHHYMPNDSIIGIMLYNSKDQVVHANMTGPLAHDIFYWEIDKNHFKKDKLSSFSKSLKQGLLGYIDSHSEEELKMIVNNLDKMCQKAHIVSLIEFKQDYHKIIDFLKACASLDLATRNKIFDLMNVIIKAIGDSKHKDFMDFVKKFKLDYLIWK